MRNVWIILVGILLIALSGFEKILIYCLLSPQFGNQLDNLINVVPSYIWNITNVTLSIGILLLGIGALLFLPNRSKVPPKVEVRGPLN